MEHTESVESLAVERYLLKEMQQAERDSFEEHFFDCSECAADVRAGATVVAAVRTGRAQVQSRPRLAWLSVAAAAAFALISGYLGGVVVPQLGGQLAAMRQERDAALQPRLLNTFRLPDVVRSASETLKIRSDRPFVLEYDIPPTAATGYVLEIVNAAGVSYGKLHVTGDEANEPVHIQPRGGKLPPGRYSLNVSPEPAGRPYSVSFEVQ
jgi:anti-sigma factor RsiW